MDDGRLVTVQVQHALHDVVTMGSKQAYSQHALHAMAAARTQCSMGVPLRFTQAHGQHAPQAAAAAGPPSATDVCWCDHTVLRPAPFKLTRAATSSSPQPEAPKIKHTDASLPEHHTSTKPPPTFAASSAIVMRLGQSSALASPPFCRAVFSRSYSEPRKQYSAPER